MAHLLCGAPLLVLKKNEKKLLVVVHRGCGAPLLVGTPWGDAPLLVKLVECPCVATGKIQKKNQTDD